MTTRAFIDQAIGKRVYITGSGDLAFRSELKKLIVDKTPLRLVKWTKSGLVYLHDEQEDVYYTVPPVNVREL